VTPAASRICVTGGLGFIGSHLCLALAERGHQITCVDRLCGTYASGTGLEAAARIRELPGARVIHADLSVDRLVPLVEDAAAVIHLAALPGVRAAHGSGAFFRHNALATARLIAAIGPGRRLVLASTSSVYGDGAPLPTPEGWPPAPMSSYGVSKLAAEHACLAAAATGLDVAIARLFTVFGPGQRSDMAFARWIDASAAGRPIPWCARPGARREFTFVGDAVRGLLAVLDRGRRGRVYNVPGAGSTSVKGALALVQEAMGVGPDRVLSLAGAQESRATAACSQRAERELGYRPRVSLQEGIRQQVAAARGSHAPEHLLALS